jgi:hypothetical protein
MRIFFLFLIPVLFVVHMAAALFSPKVRKQVSQHKMLHLGWLVISMVVAVVAIIVLRDRL